MTPDERVSYGRAVIFALQQIDSFYVMSSADFDFVAKLMDRGIPLATVLRGIEDSSHPRGRVTLRYYEPAIEDRIRMRDKALQ